MDERDWVATGPGDEDAGWATDPVLVPDPNFPGNVQPDMAGYAAGGGLLLGLFAVLERRRNRRRLAELDD